MDDPRPALASVSVGPMRRRHLGAVLAIERRVHPRPWSAELFSTELAREDRVYLVARARTGGARRLVVGYGGVLFQLDEAHVSNLAVDPSLHRRKVASHLVLHLLDEARRRGAASATLEVRAGNRGGQRLYSGFGFVPVGLRPRYYPETGEDAIVMTIEDLRSPELTERLATQTARLSAPGGASGAPDEPVPWAVDRTRPRRGGR